MIKMSLQGKNRDTLKYLKGESYKRSTNTKRGRKPLDLIEALNKTFKVKEYSTSAVIYVPNILIGKKVKLILLGGNNENEIL